jgi:glycosyltransferase involved in cell wall biosynthesis
MMKPRGDCLTYEIPDASPRLRVRLLPPLPLSIIYGGLELQCLRTGAALRQAGIAAELLDYSKADDDFDILHLVGASENFYNICLNAASRWPIIATAVSGAPNAAWWRAPIWQTISQLARIVKLQTNYHRLRMVYNLAASIICNNELESQFVRATYGIARERIEIISNGVDESYFYADGNWFTEHYGIKDFVLYTGNIVRRKNPLQLARVLRELGVPGVFIGGTLHTDLHYAEAFAEVVTNAPNLCWIPGLQHDDPLLPSAYAAARVFCLPSTSETQSQSALEAMAAGKAIILGDFPYAYQKPFENSLRCNPAEMASVQTCLEKALNNPDKYSAKLPESYSWPNVGKQIAAVYKTALATNQAANKPSVFS